MAFAADQSTTRSSYMLRWAVKANRSDVGPSLPKPVEEWFDPELGSLAHKLWQLIKAGEGKKTCKSLSGVVQMPSDGLLLANPKPDDGLLGAKPIAAPNLPSEVLPARTPRSAVLAISPWLPLTPRRWPPSIDATMAPATIQLLRIHHCRPFRSASRLQFAIRRLSLLGWCSRPLNP